MIEPINIEEKQYWLLLHRLHGFGQAKFKILLNQSPKLSTWFNGEKPTSALLDALKSMRIKPSFDWRGVEQDLAFAQDTNSHIITIHDAAYPDRLKEISSAPVVLFVKGNLGALKTNQIAMVGSRHPTPTGQENAYLFAKSLAQAGLTITSGLALGIDGVSHKGTLAAKGTTIAVLGQGFPDIYPRRHAPLSSEILQHGGAIVSEFATHTAILPSNFPRRNRIISGLSLGVLVVEATIKSGSLITAMQALEQGREVFAIPGSVHNPLAKGCHHLIRQGAKCVETQQHILDEILPMIPAVGKPTSKVGSIKNVLPNKEDLSSQLKSVLRHIGDECTPIERVVERTGLTVTQITPILSELELEDRVSLVPGGYIRI